MSELDAHQCTLPNIDRRADVLLALGFIEVRQHLLSVPMYYSTEVRA